MAADCPIISSSVGCLFLAHSTGPGTCDFIRTCRPRSAHPSHFLSRVPLNHGNVLIFLFKLRRKLHCVYARKRNAVPVTLHSECNFGTSVPFPSKIALRDITSILAMPNCKNVKLLTQGRSGPINLRPRPGLRSSKWLHVYSRPTPSPQAGLRLAQIIKMLYGSAGPARTIQAPVGLFASWVIHQQEMPFDQGGHSWCVWWSTVLIVYWFPWPVPRCLPDVPDSHRWSEGVCLCDSLTCFTIFLASHLS